MKIKRVIGITTLLLVTTLAVSVFQRAPVFAATLIVDSTADSTDSSAGDGSCDDGAGNCTLRAAIEEANALSGSDTINFAIAGSGPFTISPATAYPGIRHTVIIDGTSQPGTACGTLVPSLPSTTNTGHTLKIIIDGSGPGVIFDFDGLSISDDASGSIIRGFNLVNTAGYFGTISVRPSSGAVADNMQINCNYIGTNITGSSAQANNIGIAMYGSSGSDVSNNLISGNTSSGFNGGNGTINIHHNLIGTNKNGTAAIPNGNGLFVSDGPTLSTNVISGNTNGVRVYDASNILANFIGLGIGGAPLGNAENGIELRSSGSSVGNGTNSGRNYISANGDAGVWLHGQDGGGDGCSDGSTSNNTVSANSIGTNTASKVETGYGNDIGVQISAQTSNSCQAFTSDNTIGGHTPTAGNIIAGNNKQGVLVFDSEANDAHAKNNSIIGNRTFKNGLLNIDLAQDTDNDGVPDSMLGANPLNGILLSDSSFANHYVNHPTINSATLTGNKLVVDYSFTANPPGTDSVTGYQLDFYMGDSLDESGTADSSIYVGSFIVNSSETNATHTFTVDGLDASTSYFTSGTATVLYSVCLECIE